MACHKSATDIRMRRIGSTRRCRAFTLLEMTVSVAVLGLLAVGMSSAILLATHALPGKSTPQSRKVEGANLLQQMAADLAYATTIPVRNPSSITFTVHDRNQGLAGAESMNFTWSGVVGNPLTYQLNASTASTLSTSVASFSIDYQKETIPLKTAPSVLMLVINPATLTQEESDRKSLIESWGMTVSTLSRDATSAELQAAATSIDVLYILSSTYRSTLVSAINGLTRGVVTADLNSYTAVGIAPSGQNYAQRTLNITNNSHEITSIWATGNINLITSNDQLVYADAPLASGATVLADLSVLIVLNGPSLIVLDYGNTTSQGTPATSRRVKLPWADGVSVSELTDEAKILLQRSLTWAAAPRVISSVQLTLQIGTNSDSKVQTAVKMLNQPREDGT